MAVSDEDLRRNRLLAALPDERRAQIGERAEVVSLSVRDVVFEQGKPIEHIHFPLSGVVSLVSNFGDSAVEIATIGKEGMVGLPVFLQAAFASTHMAFCQVSAETVRMPVDAFTETLSGDGDMHTILHRYTQALFTQVSQNAACNAVHDVPRRTARWILMTHDRMDSDEFELTQEFLAQMLGVRRTAVNAAAQRLQDNACISYTRGRMVIRDRDALLKLACPCYEIIRAEHDRMVP